MDVTVRAYEPQDLEAITAIWNKVVEDAEAFPQTEPMTPTEAAQFFAEQSHTGVAVDGEEVLGLYILHPNNIGRCGHISNASYAVGANARGRGVGEALVRDSLLQGRRLGFRLLQFNAVVCTNTYAIRLYKKLGFQQLGTVPGGFRLGDGSYTDILLFYIEL